MTIINCNENQRDFVTENINGRPGTEEIYTCAGNASNLRVQADRTGSADVLIAAGWSESRLGMALLRLHTVWDAAEKPCKPTKHAVEALALTLPTKNKLPDLSRAANLANEWYLHELHKLVGKLNALPDVRREVVRQAEIWCIADSASVVPAVIKYWLDQNCHACGGLKWKVVPGAPSLSNRACHACRGSGVGTAPHGQDGKKLCNFLDDCVSRAQQSIRSRLRNTKDAVSSPTRTAEAA